MLPIHRTGTTLSMRSALAVTVSSLFILSSFVAAEPNQSTVEALLSNLPAPGSAAYRTLYEKRLIEAVERPLLFAKQIINHAYIAELNSFRFPIAYSTLYR